MEDKRLNSFSKEVDEAEARLEAVRETSIDRWNDKTLGALLNIVRHGFEHFTISDNEEPTIISKSIRNIMLEYGEKEVIKAFIALSNIHNIFPRLFADIFPWTGKAPFNHDILMECGDDIRSTLRAYYTARKTTEIPDFAKECYDGEFLNI